MHNDGRKLVTEKIRRSDGAGWGAEVAGGRGRRGGLGGPVGEYLATLGWEHITLTGTYRWDLTATSTLENLLTDHPR